MISRVLLFTSFVIFASQAHANPFSRLGSGLESCKKSIVSFARELADRTEANNNSVTVALPPAHYCKNQPRLSKTKKAVSFYGDGSDGFAGKKVRCESVLDPKYRKMNPRLMTVALREDIFERLMSKSGKEDSIRNICGAKIILYRPGVGAVEAIVTDSGDLGLTNKDIQPMRDVDMSPAVRDALRIKSDTGVVKDVTYFVCSEKA